MSFTIIGKRSFPLAFALQSDCFVGSNCLLQKNGRDLAKAHPTPPHWKAFSSTAAGSESPEIVSKPKGKILVLGGTGFVGSEIVRQGVMKGYTITSLSRRGNLLEGDALGLNELSGRVDYVKGDALNEVTVKEILASSEEPFAGCIHALGLLLDGQSGLGKYNRLASGSGTVPDETTTYDDITRKSAFYAIEALRDYAKDRELDGNFPFVFISAAEAGWPDKKGGSFIENNLAPDWLRRYLTAKRAVEEKMMNSTGSLRPVIFRPSPIYSFSRFSTLPAASAFVLGNTIGLPFVDRPVSVEALSTAVLQSIGDSSVSGIQRYKEIEKISAASK